MRGFNALIPTTHETCPRGLLDRAELDNILLKTIKSLI